eukprot:SAG22_NODE_136_length_18095_cov_19.897255_26_plen_105_part_00
MFSQPRGAVVLSKALPFVAFLSAQTDGEREAAAALGWQPGAEGWDSGAMPAVAELVWAELSPDQQASAVRLHACIFMRLHAYCILHGAFCILRSAMREHPACPL